MIPRSGGNAKLNETFVGEQLSGDDELERGMAPSKLAWLGARESGSMCSAWTSKPDPARDVDGVSGSAGCSPERWLTGVVGLDPALAMWSDRRGKARDIFNGQSDSNFSNKL